jgi:hypothetical protein
MFLKYLHLVTDDIASGVTIERFLSLLEEHDFLTAIHKSFNQRDGHANADIILAAAELLHMNQLTYQDVYDARITFDFYDNDDFEGVSIDEHLQRVRSLLMACGRMAALPVLTSTLLKLYKSVTLPHRLRFPEFLRLLSACRPLSAKLARQAPTLLRSADLYKIEDFDEILMRPDQRLQRELDDAYDREQKSLYVADITSVAPTRPHSSLKTRSSLKSAQAYTVRGILSAIHSSNSELSRARSCTRYTMSSNAAQIASTSTLADASLYTDADPVAGVPSGSGKPQQLAPLPRLSHSKTHRLHVSVAADFGPASEQSPDLDKIRVVGTPVVQVRTPALSSDDRTSNEDRMATTRFDSSTHSRMSQRSLDKKPPTSAESCSTRASASCLALSRASSTKSNATTVSYARPLPSSATVTRNKGVERRGKVTTSLSKLRTRESDPADIVKRPTPATEAVKSLLSEETHKLVRAHSAKPQSLSLHADDVRASIKSKLAGSIFFHSFNHKNINLHSSPFDS